MTSADGIPTRRTVIGGGLLAALLFLAVWIPLHPARPHLPTSDLYEHLSTARHLCAGDGFVTDMTYPLSFAFPFARELPQPLIHRGPGYPLLMTLPQCAGGDDSGRVLEDVRLVQIVLLGLLIWLGASAWLARGRAMNLGPWLVLLAANPLLVFAVDWAFNELVCGLLLLASWLRIRDADPARGGAKSGLVDGMLAGCLVAMRLDLFWVPILWWLGIRRLNRRRLLAAALMTVLLALPWEIRKVQLTGRPFFSLQSQAELVKGTPDWPDYDVYRQLEPQPATQALREMPGAVLHKTASGVKFHLLNLKRLLPGWYWLGLIAVGLATVTGPLRRPQTGVARIPQAVPVTDGKRRPAPLFAATVTLGLLILQYSFFDHSLRHLLVLLPVLVWELAPWTGEFALRAFEQRGRRLPGRGAARISAAMILTLAGVLLFPIRLPGWNHAAWEAGAAAGRMPSLVAAARQTTEPILFTEYSAVCYLADRPAVWTPRNEAVRRQIQDLFPLLYPPSSASGNSPMPEDLTP